MKNNSIKLILSFFSISILLTGCVSRDIYLYPVSYPEKLYYSESYFGQQIELKAEAVDFSKVKTIYIAVGEGAKGTAYSLKALSLYDISFEPGSLFREEEAEEFFADLIEDLTDKEIRIIEDISKLSENQQPFTTDKPDEEIILFISYDETTQDFDPNFNGFCLPAISLGTIPQNREWYGTINLYYYNPSIKKILLLGTQKFDGERTASIFNILRPWRWNDHENKFEEGSIELIKSVFKKAGAKIE